MKKIAKFIRSDFIFLLLMFLILFINFRFEKFFVMTGSMEPTLPIGTVVFIDGHDLPEEGDICAYRLRGNIIIHRVTDITEDGSFVTKGDNNPEPDLAEVAEDQVIGKEAFHVSFIAPLVRKLAGL